MAAIPREHAHNVGWTGMRRREAVNKVEFIHIVCRVAVLADRRSGSQQQDVDTGQQRKRKKERIWPVVKS